MATEKKETAPEQEIRVHVYGDDLETSNTVPMRLPTVIEQHVALQQEQKAINKRLNESKAQLLAMVKDQGDQDTEGRAVYVHDGNKAMVFPETSYDALEKLEIVLTAVPKKYHRLIVKKTPKKEYVKVSPVRE